MDEITLKLEPKSVGIILDMLDDQLTLINENPAESAVTHKQLEAIIKEISDQLDNSHVNIPKLYRMVG